MAEELSKKQQVLQDLKKLILARTSIVYLLSDEEYRVEGLLKELSATFQPRPKLYVWNPFYGLFGENERIEGSVSPVEALDKVIQRNEQTFYLFEGLQSYLKTDLLIARKLKDIHRALRNRYSTVFIGRTWRLQDLTGPAVYDRSGSDLTWQGLYLDMPAWGYHVFAVSPAE